MQHDDRRDVIIPRGGAGTLAKWPDASVIGLYLHALLLVPEVPAGLLVLVGRTDAIVRLYLL
jgi:hypothetical protein